MTEIQQALQKLSGTILQIVTDAKAQRAIQPEQQALWKWRVKEFEYGEQGITKSQAEGQYITNKTWLKASRTLGKALSETADLTSALSKLTEGYPTATRQDLDRFAATILDNCLSSESADEAQRENEETIRKFLNDVSGGLVTYKAKVELIGVILQPTNILLDDGIDIRQPTKEYIEKAV